MSVIHNLFRLAVNSLRGRVVALIAFMLAAISTIGAGDQLSLVSNAPVQIFSGQGRSIPITLYNAGNQAVDVDLYTLLYQTSSATAIPRGEVKRTGKRLTVLAGQTVLESATLNFPSIKSETKFVIKWLEGTNRVVGTTEVWAYPTNLLSELKTLAGERLLGTLDPDNQLKPLLKAAGVAFSDLESAEVENYPGKLVIVGPLQSKEQVRETVTGQLKVLAEKGVAVVWLQPPPEQKEDLRPSFYAVRKGKGFVIIAQACLVSSLSEKPESQLNLIYLSRLAVRPEAQRLPFLAQQPE